MRTFAAISTLMLSASSALAHGGHLAEAGGHSHYLVVGAGVVAAAILIGAFVRSRRADNV